MSSLPELKESLKDAIQALNGREVDKVLRSPSFHAFSAQDLDDVFEIVSPILQDKEFLQRIISHPVFHEASGKTVGHLTRLAIRQGDADIIDYLLDHLHFREMPTQDAEQIIMEALDFQDRALVSRLIRMPLFKPHFERHVDKAVQCAIRTQDREWVELLFKQIQDDKVASQIFPYVIRWALKRKDRKLINLSLRYVHLDPINETVLKQALFDTALDDTARQLEIENYVVEQLIKHPDYLNLSPALLSWLLEKALILKKEGFFKRFIHHPHYPSLVGEQLTILLIQACASRLPEAQKIFMQHPHFDHINGPDLGLVLEEAIRSEASSSLLNKILHHSRFQDIPEDSFNRLTTMAKNSSLNLLRDLFLHEPLFRAKCGQSIYEAIRRNDSNVIDQLFRDPLFKDEVINQLINYAKTDQFFVSFYIIRDVLREAFLTQDETLITPLNQHPLFQTRIEELMRQTIEYDDDEFIECVLRNDLLRERFHQALKLASAEDKARLSRLFPSQPIFKE